MELNCNATVDWSNIPSEISQPHTFVLFHPDYHLTMLSLWWDAEASKMVTWNAGKLDETLDENLVAQVYAFHLFMRSALASLERPARSKVEKRRSRRPHHMKNTISIGVRRRSVSTHASQPAVIQRAHRHLDHKITVMGHKRVYRRGTRDEFVVDVRPHSPGPKGCKKLIIAKVTRYQTHLIGSTKRKTILG
jgi:hypothetical protein